MWIWGFNHRESGWFFPDVIGSFFNGSFGSHNGVPVTPTWTRNDKDMTYSILMVDHMDLTDRKNERTWFWIMINM